MRRHSSGDGVTYIRLEFVEEPDEGPWLWRPSGKDDELALGEPPIKSIPVMVWGLLKSDAWSGKELARTLGCHRRSIYDAVRMLRNRGHRIVLRHGKYHLENDLPLRVVVERGRAMRLARMAEKTEVEIEELW